MHFCMADTASTSLEESEGLNDKYNCLESGMVFEGTTGLYERLYQYERKKEK